MGRILAKYDDPAGTRFGIPTYYWCGAPKGYATRRQLREMGLCPGGQDIAMQIKWRGVGGERTAYLYSIEAARPKRTATPAVMEAVRKALIARRTCPTCLSTKDYYLRTSRGECADCAAIAGHPY